MLEALRRPLALPHLAAAVAVAAVLIALYCVAYTWLAGRPETLATGLAWAVANVCPWLVAVEAGKRAHVLPHDIGDFAAALMSSLALGYLVGVSNDSLGFEVLRRLPALLAAAAIVTLMRSSVGHRPSRDDLPLLPRQIDW